MGNLENKIQNFRLNLTSDMTRSIFFIALYFDDFFSRKSYAEKFLIVTKYREGHKCDYQWTVMAIIKWDGIKADIGKQKSQNVFKSISKSRQNM